MKKLFQLLLAVFLSLFISVLIFHFVSAHQTVSVGDYQVEVGWLDEPPVVGQRNAIVVNVSGTTPDSSSSSSTDAKADTPVSTETVDISGLKVDVIYGGETKTLTLQPLSEDSQGQYIAPILPTRPGKYTVKLSGTLGTTTADAEVQPEEVEMADTLQFPRTIDSTAQQTDLNPSIWVAAAALLVGLAALGVAVVSLRKYRQ